MTQEEMLKKIQEFEDSLTPEERLKWLQEVNQKIKETNEDVKGLLAVLQEAKDKAALEGVQSKLKSE